jgi:hypothetical protein
MAVTSVESTSKGALAGFAERGNDLPSLWMSSLDGIGWQEATKVNELQKAAGGYLGLQSNGDRFLADGQYGAGTQLWTSLDGRTWTSLARVEIPIVWPRLEPRGVFLGPAGACPGVKNDCFPADFPYYGAAK